MDGSPVTIKTKTIPRQVRFKNVIMKNNIFSSLFNISIYVLTHYLLSNCRYGRWDRRYKYSDSQDGQLGPNLWFFWVLHKENFQKLSLSVLLLTKYLFSILLTVWVVRFLMALMWMYANGEWGKTISLVPSVAVPCSSLSVLLSASVFFLNDSSFILEITWFFF